MLTEGRRMRTEKQRTKPYIALVALWACLALTLCSVGAISGTAKADLRRVPYQFSVDQITDGSPFGGASTIHIYHDYVFPADGTLSMAGWVATDEGIDHYEYAWVTDYHHAPVWQRASGERITARGDLSATGVPYPGGHGTAGFSFDVLPLAGMSDGYYDLYVRAVTGDGVGCDLALFSHMMYGTPDDDDGEKRIVSFPRLEKTQGALVRTEVSEAGLAMTNASVAFLGEMSLDVFERVEITCSLSQSYVAERQALIGFKSAPEHLYGDGEGLYDLTDHITALPLNTDTTDPQTVALDLSKVDLKAHDGVYLSAYVKNGVTLTVHEIKLTYRGKGYDRTAAKIYFSSDVIGRFSGINLVTLQGVNDAVMGDVLRIEVIEETNDPFAHFNASSLMSDHDIRLSADDYKYMVVLARASADNQNDSMTFYLCAGSIYGATEACTYTHRIIPDGQWHYYVFDLTARENWKGGINGWRFDIINGNCRPGDYVDFASVQFFSTKEAAEAAASASVTKNDEPYALGKPAVVRDDAEDQIVSNAPVIFKDGDWFEEMTTAPETEPSTPPEETDHSDPAVTLNPEESQMEEVTGESTPAEGCSSLISAIPLILSIPLICILKKKKLEET